MPLPSPEPPRSARPSRPTPLRPIPLPLRFLLSPPTKRTAAAAAPSTIAATCHRSRRGRTKIAATAASQTPSCRTQTMCPLRRRRRRPRLPARRPTCPLAPLRTCPRRVDVTMPATAARAGPTHRRIITAVITTVTTVACTQSRVPSTVKVVRTDCCQLLRQKRAKERATWAAARRAALTWPVECRRRR
ncbi:hypothetical protein ABB37_08236 [Leptomonas pyrrhocoris]|uniref:Uncharacterized protein n=1 Tax=Leptomonas pyrrhocoris TaxID=157538 RepID=A0A0M9FTD5_LEPPY|nr:hypothetical protein ABB37_08236 [Leptomonas pyrrhocoris]KPA75675.1 hypothetical protein ABB37_08236 [Leptomonas pyrrhocoris]|eukprot:XP_015654114.1 hypothetical protein ABB37_08236 [Leptomonas pyrrhocoris]